MRASTAVAASTAKGVASVKITPASPARATTGSVVAYLATVTAVSGGGGNALSGTISFTVNSKALTGCSFLSLSSDTAICTITFADPGTYRIVASYGYDPNFAAPEATVTEVVVTAVTPSETVVVTPSPVVAGGEATLSVHLSGPHGAVSGRSRSPTARRRSVRCRFGAARRRERLRPEGLAPAGRSSSCATRAPATTGHTKDAVIEVS